MDVKYGEEFPLPEEAIAATQRNVPHDEHWLYFTVHRSADVAAAIVQSRSATFPMKVLLSVNIACHQNNYPGGRPQQFMQGVPPSEVHGCSPDVRYDDAQYAFCQPAESAETRDHDESKNSRSDFRSNSIDNVYSALGRRPGYENGRD